MPLRCPRWTSSLDRKPNGSTSGRRSLTWSSSRGAPAGVDEQFRVPALAGPVRLTRREWTAVGWFSGSLSINTHCRVGVALHEEGSVTLLKNVNAWDRALATEYRGVVG